jgi:hypothetical protein
VKGAPLWCEIAATLFESGLSSARRRFAIAPLTPQAALTSGVSPNYAAALAVYSNGKNANLYSFGSNVTQRRTGEPFFDALGGTSHLDGIVRAALDGGNPDCCGVRALATEAAL